MAKQLSIESVKTTLKGLGWDKIKDISSVRIAIVTDKNRKEVLRDVAISFKNFNARYDPNAKGSSAGAVILEGFSILAKPIKFSIFAKPETRGLPGPKMNSS